MVRTAFQKDLSGCGVENGLSSVEYVKLRAFVRLTPEPSRHYLKLEPLSPWPNTSLSPQMLLLRNLGRVRTLPPLVGARRLEIDLIPALPPTRWVTLGQFLPCQPLKGGQDQ